MTDIHSNNQPDRILVNKVLQGDTHAFAVIIKNTERLVAQIIFKMIANKEDRKDIAQDIYLKAFHKLGSFKFEAKLSTWIAQIAYNTCFSFLEKKKLLLAGDMEGLDASDNDAADAGYFINTITGAPGERFLYERDLKDILDAAIEKLPTVYKTLVSLYHIEDCSYDEIAHITKLPPGTVKSYLFRARKALKETISKNYKRSDL